MAAHIQTHHMAKVVGMRQFTYYGYRALAGLFALGGLLQFFLAGLGVFESRTLFETHATIGTILALFSVILFIVAIGVATAGNLAREGVGTAALLVVLMAIQYLLVELFSEPAPLLAALHPVNGLLVVAVAVLIASGRHVTPRAWRTSRRS